MTSALRDLESVLMSAPRSAADIKPSLMRLSTSVKERLRDPDFASIGLVRDGVRIISKVRHAAFAQLRYDVLCASVPYLYAHGSLEDALIAADAMRAVSEGMKSKAAIRRAENHLGIIHEGLGNVAQAIIHYHTALQLAREIADEDGQVSVLVNLGAAFCNGGLFREAIACFQRGEQLAAREPARRRLYEPMFLGNITSALWQMGDLGTAFATMRRCVALASEPPDVHSAYARTSRELVFTQVALDAGDLKEARIRADACRQYASSTGTGLATINATLATGLCDVYGGDAQRGLAGLEQARQRTSSLELVYHRADALTALVRAYEYCSQPADALSAMRQLLDHVCARRQAAVSAILSLDASREPISDPTMDLQAMKLKEAHLRAATAELHAESSIVSSTFEMLERLAVTASLREDPSGQHGYRVGRLSGLLAESARLSRAEQFTIEIAGRLHDVGKVALPDRILLSSEGLREEERRFLRNHTTMGAELLSKGEMRQLRVAEQVARFHHEWWDGSGYPTGIGGERIPLPARIVALADVFDALTHGRPYATAWPVAKALAEIEQLAGRQFEPKLAIAFVALVKELQQRHGDLDAYLEQAAGASPFASARKNIAQMLGHA
jgi:putative two-component system response regulator